ncbi:hypothetical protein MML48_4g00006127 [Holotrichia oblita]|uniref:Uncharacterized protein n=1 Tax=Holotrichia oblita TaxID=644536 RepID=A0ACB9T7K2_HOLOL|nr:hypothetical protein MML48_4g00006127 [Holotrichia oblita]
MFSFLFLLCLIYLAPAQDLTLTADIKTLSELPLQKLLHVKNSLFLDDNIHNKLNVENFTSLNEENNPNALALKTNSKDVKRFDKGDDSKDKGSIQSIFQISVTALAFLAFGGYLVCLVTQAINGKDGTQQIIVMDSLKRPIRYKQRPNIRYRTPSTRRPTIHRLKRELQENDEIDFEKLYEALISISEGYTNVHTRHWKKM